MTFGQEVDAKLALAMGRDPEADEGVMRRQVEFQVKDERRKRAELEASGPMQEQRDRKPSDKPKSVADLLAGGFIKKGI